MTATARRSPRWARGRERRVHLCHGPPGDRPERRQPRRRARPTRRPPAVHRARGRLRDRVRRPEPPHPQVPSELRDHAARLPARQEHPGAPAWTLGQGSDPTSQGRPDRDRARTPSLPAATNAAASSVAVSSAAPITHHQKKTNTDATNSPSPRPPTKAAAQANRGRRLRAASNRRRRCQRPPASSPTPASRGTSATISTRDKPCPGLIGISSGPSRLAGTTNRSNARANKLPHPSSHLIPALGAATTSPSPQP